MHIKTTSFDNIYSIVINFNKGDKCFCCDKSFQKKTEIVKSFVNINEFKQYCCELENFFNIKIK